LLFSAVISEHFSKNRMIISVVAATIWYLKNVWFLLGHPVLVKHHQQMFQYFQFTVINFCLWSFSHSCVVFITYFSTCGIPSRHCVSVSVCRHVVAPLAVGRTRTARPENTSVCKRTSCVA